MVIQLIKTVPGVENMISEKQVSLITKKLKERLDPCLVYLFGSAIKGGMTGESDVDIAFLGDESPDEYEVFVIAQEIACMLDRDVDLINLAEASTVLQAQVVSTGRIIYCKHPEKRPIYEMKVLKEYARLNEQRRPIVERIKERGSVYGK
jgi:predicted nucleotidyltransferase